MNKHMKFESEIDRAIRLTTRHTRINEKNVIAIGVTTVILLVAGILAIVQTVLLWH